MGAGEVPLWRSLVVVLLGGLTWMFFCTKNNATIAPEAGVVMHMPGYVSCRSGFVGTTAEVTEPERRILPTDTEFARKNYTDFPGTDNIFCGIVLSGATDQSIHRPEACLVGQGWNITNTEDVPIKLSSGRTLTVKNLTIKRAVTTLTGKTFTLTSYNMYWFVGNGVTTPYHYMRMFLSSWDRIVHNRANRWAYVTVSSPIMQGLVKDGLDPAQTKALMVDFIKAIVPSFQKSEMADGGKQAEADAAASGDKPVTADTHPSQ